MPRLGSILLDESTNQENEQPLANDLTMRQRNYQQTRFLQPGQTLDTDSTKTLWLIAAALAAIYLLKKK